MTMKKRIMLTAVVMAAVVILVEATARMAERKIQQTIQMKI